MFNRRDLVTAGAFATAAILIKELRPLGVRAAEKGAPPPARFDVTHTEAEWHRLLTPQQFDVLRRRDGASLHEPAA